MHSDCAAGHSQVWPASLRVCRQKSPRPVQRAKRNMTPKRRQPPRNNAHTGRKEKAPDFQPRLACWLPNRHPANDGSEAPSHRADIRAPHKKRLPSPGRALRMELAAAGDNMKKLREIAKVHIARWEAGDMQAIKELADRLDGKPGQLLEHSVPDREPLTKIVREIVHVNRLTDLPGIVPGLDLEVALQQLNDREIGGRLAVR